MSAISYASAELAALAGARNHYRWILSRFAPYLGRRIVEVGAGVGTFARLLLDEVEPAQLVLVEPAGNLAPLLRARFAGDARVEVVHGYLDALPARLEADGVVLVKVLEHVEHEAPFLEAAVRVLATGGCLLVFVPAGPWLFGTLDAAFGHHRRYTKPALERALRGAGLRLRFVRYFNAPGVVGWFAAGRLLRRRTLAPRGVALYDRWVIPWLARVEAVWSPPFGRSLVAVASTTAPPTAPAPSSRRSSRRHRLGSGVVRTAQDGPPPRPRRRPHPAAAAQSRQGSGAPARIPGGDGQRRRRPGRRPGVRSAGVLPPDRPDSARARRRGLRLPLPGRAASRPLLLARGRQPRSHHRVEHVHQPQSLRRVDVLQGLPAGGAARPRSARGSVRLRAGDHGQGGEGRLAHLRGPPSPTGGARTPRARRSRGRTV